MKKIIIIVGGVLSLTIMLMILIAIFMAISIKDELTNIWDDNVQRTSQSVQIQNVIAAAQETRASLISNYHSFDTPESCHQLAMKLYAVEISLARGNITLPRASLEKIGLIKQAMQDTSLPMQGRACEQANKVIERLIE